MTSNTCFTSQPAIRILLLAVASLAVGSAQASDYQLFDLGTGGGPYSGAYAINSQNQITGVNSRGTPVEDQGWVVTRWSGTAMHLIDDPGRYNGGWAINSAGVIGGGSSHAFVGYIHAAIWTGDTRTDLIDLGGATEPMDNRWSIASGINDNGQVVGTSVLADQSATRAVLWNNSVNPTVLNDLGGSYAEANGVNNAGFAVGDSLLADDLTTHATLWNLATGAVSDLGTLGGDNSAAWAINASGQVAGWSEATVGGGAHATLWSGGNLTDLGTLGGLNSQALALNNQGLLVGWSETADGTRHATLWEGNQSIDLNSLLPQEQRDAGWILLSAAGVNDNGWIVGSATHGQIGGVNQDSAFLLVPTAVPVPAAVWLFGSALAGLIGLGRRKSSP